MKETKKMRKSGGFQAAALAVLCMAGSLVSCFNPLQPVKPEPAEYTADGRRLVSVSVKTAAGGGGSAHGL